MKRKASELSRIARDLLNNRYTMPMGAFVAAGLIPTVLEIPFSMVSNSSPTTIQLVITGLAEFLITLIEQVLFIGVWKGHLDLTRNHPFKIRTIFAPFKSGTDRYFGAAFIFDLMLLLLLCPAILAYTYYNHNGAGTITVTLLVAGICVSAMLVFVFLIHYLLVFHYLLEFPQMKVLSAFKECRLSMRGNKMRMFSILFRFVGWIFLIICSFGIAALWVGPYMIELLTVFYLDITGELDRIPVRDYKPQPGSSQNLFF